MRDDTTAKAKPKTPRPITTAKSSGTGGWLETRSARQNGMAAITAPHSRASGTSRDKPSGLRRMTFGAIA